MTARPTLPDVKRSGNGGHRAARLELSISGPSDGLAAVKTEGRLLIVSNRLPVTATLDGGCLTLRDSSGGLASGLAAYHAGSEGLWIGWSGATQRIAGPQSSELAREFVTRKIVPVPLDRHEVHEFYDRVSNGVLWPVFHDRLDRVPLIPPRWEVYEHINARFADIVSDVYRPGDTIWVHDYQLLRVPALIRERVPGARIGFFLHVPFPAPGVFQALAPREQYIDGMLGADLIGFHTRRDVDNFKATLERTPNVGVRPDGLVTLGNRRVRVDCFPMGVDASAFAARAASSVVETTALALKSPQRLLLGIDRLDYSKGIPRRLLAVDELLTRYPEWRGRLRLIQIAVPSRERLRAYRKLRREVEELVGHINGKFATPTWTPIHYMNGSISPDLVTALYRAADVMLVTPVRDGMNLVAKEFVASRIDDDGILLLSEFAGAAEELREAMRINPYNTSEVAQAIRSALIMGVGERRHRMTRLRARVAEHDIHWWAGRFLRTLLAQHG